MKQLLQQTKWQFILLARNNIISISIAITVVYGLIFFGLKGLPNVDKMLTLLILNDPAIIGLFFIGVGLLMEKNQHLLSALFVTPIDHHSYLISRIISLSIVGWLCALGMCVAALGLDFNVLHFSAGVIGISIMTCLAGFYLIFYTSEFMRFMLKSVPVLLIFVNAPMLNYFNLTDWKVIDCLPIQGSLNLLINSYSDTPNMNQIMWGYVSIFFWVPLLYWLVYRSFIRKIVNA